MPRRLDRQRRGRVRDQQLPPRVYQDNPARQRLQRLDVLKPCGSCVAALAGDAREMGCWFLCADS